jgi:DNA-binding FadR family transcriptional regulator
MKTNKLGEVERVYRILRDWLKAAKLPPGEFLSEIDLAERCGTSRTPVREACTRLMQDKWLSRIRRKGFMVTPISVRDIIDMYEYRKLLECSSAEKVARRPKDKSKSGAPSSPGNQSGGGLTRYSAGQWRVPSAVGGTCRQPAGNHPTEPDPRLCDSPGYALHPNRARLDWAWRHSSIYRDPPPAQARQAMQVHIDDSRDKMVKLFGA